MPGSWLRVPWDWSQGPADCIALSRLPVFFQLLLVTAGLSSLRLWGWDPRILAGCQSGLLSVLRPPSFFIMCPPQNKAAGNASSLESHGLLYLSFSQDGLWWEKMDSGSLVGYMGCHLLSLFDLYKMKALVAQSCLTLCSPMDCSLLGSSVHGILQARESSYSLVQQIFPIQGFFYCKQILYSLSHQGSPQNSAT